MIAIVAVLALLAVYCFQINNAFILRPNVISRSNPIVKSKTTSLKYTSIKVEIDPTEEGDDVVNRYFNLLMESDVLDIAMSKQRMETKNDRKKRRRINARVKTLKYADADDEDEEDDFPDYGDTKLPQYQDLRQ